MSECEDLLSSLSHTLDQPHLPPSADKDLKQLIPRDSGCRPLAQALIEIDMHLREAPLAAPSHDLSAAILKRIAQQPSHDGRLLAVMFLLTSSFAVVPTVLFVIIALTVVLIRIRPATIQLIVQFFLDLLHNFYTLSLMWNTMQTILSPWLLPFLLFAFSSIFLTLTLIVVRRLSLQPQLR